MPNLKLMKRLLLDENLPRKLKDLFSSEFDVTSVPDLGWQSKKNGELLSAMDAVGIEFLLTADRNLRFQQNFEKYAVRIVVLRSFDNRLKTLAPNIAKIEGCISDSNAAEKIIEIDLRNS